MSTARPETYGERTRALVEALRRRVVGGVVAALAVGTLLLSASPAGGFAASVLVGCVAGLALWLSTRESAQAAPGSMALTGAQTAVLAIVVVLVSADVLVPGRGAPLHGLAVLPFAIAGFALSSRRGRDLRSALAATAAALCVLSVADARAAVVAGCAAGLVVLLTVWPSLLQLLHVELHTAQPGAAYLSITEPGRRPWAAESVATLAAVTVVATLLLPMEPHPHLRQGQGGAAGTAPPGARGLAMVFGNSQLDLSVRGALDDTPLLSVPAASPQYWQGSWYDSYDGRSWGRADAAALARRLPQSLPTGSGAQDALVQVLVPVPALPPYSPGPLLGAVADGADLLVSGAGQPYLSSGEGGEVASYAVDYRTTDDWTGALATSPWGTTDPHWLQLPTGLPDRVRTLARQLTAAAGDTPGKVAAVETYLRTHEKYQLDSPVPGGDDAVDAFLFRDHVGFCEQFASAETVLLRAVGVPARLATGFVNGTPGAAGQRVYRNKDAHAWVQVGYPDGRWATSDPTAGAGLAHPVTPRQSLWQRLWHELSSSATARRLLAGAVLVLAVLALAVARVLRRRWRRRQDRVAAERERWRPERSTAATDAWDRLTARLADQGRPRLPSETVRDVLLRLVAPQRPLVVAVLESEWYGEGAPPSPDAVATVVAVLDGLAQEQPAGATP